MSKQRIEFTEEYKRFTLVSTFYNSDYTEGEGHRCGYVGLPAEHSLNDIDYNDTVDHEAFKHLLGRTVEDGRAFWLGIFCAKVLEEEGISIRILFDVHGGITYSDRSSTYPVPSDNLFWYGFDCAHLDNHPSIQTEEYVRKELHSFADQLIEYESILAAKEPPDEA